MDNSDEDTSNSHHDHIKLIEYIEKGYIPVFKCDVEKDSSRLTVSRIICQYANLGTRSYQSVNSSQIENCSEGVSPLFFSALL